MNCTGRFALPLVCLSLFSLPAFAQSPRQEQQGLSGPASSEWLVTVGAWTYAQPEFEGSNDLTFGASPIINIRRRGEREWLSLPNDHGGPTLFSTANFRFGPSFNFVRERDDDDALRGLGSVDWALEVGAFAEFWPADFFRTRVEVRRGFNGHEGFVADLSADAVWRLAPAWTLTAGPRLSVADGEYMSTYFSVSPFQSITSGLARYDAKGGFKSAGVGSSLTYQWTPAVATTAFVEYERLLGDAAKSPIVEDRGSPDQLTVGMGVKYTFSVVTANWPLFSGR
ncbi:MipA/OmpV family protein [Bradyrhizobium sp. LHD-71]|uniref:MipA/OmpV family protein n=1 Tax=Bradyrhizobium sp. LHD-71 TaxID=3072141 RepID=UPI00280F6653|nr:MipA/OmpV family protein [Bradyrhizobium sp. LHD-71]MDQ8730232.1 MipA/OmpV family protein [Bradyrhizobium sp. LHD-71]